MLSLVFRTMIKMGEVTASSPLLLPSAWFLGCQDLVMLWSPSLGSDKEVSPSAPRAALPRAFEAIVTQRFGTSIWTELRQSCHGPFPSGLHPAEEWLMEKVLQGSTK